MICNHLFFHFIHKFTFLEVVVASFILLNLSEISNWPYADIYSLNTNKQLHELILGECKVKYQNSVKIEIYFQKYYSPKIFSLSSSEITTAIAVVTVESWHDSVADTIA